jgi:hypothetical protein
MPSEGSLNRDPSFITRPRVPRNAHQNILTFTATYPVAGVDFAKLIFWSFLAGFSERLVPQIISKTSTTRKKDE